MIIAAPKIYGWTFIAFKPSIPGHFKSKWDDLELNTEEMWFLPLLSEKNNDLGIRICLKNYDVIKDNEILTPLLYKMLDTILGEKSFALNIKHVDTALQPHHPEEEGMLNYQNTLRDINLKRPRAAGNMNCVKKQINL